MSITRINTNFDAMFAQNQIKKLELSISKSTQRLSTGNKIITAGDAPMEVGMLTTATAQLRGNMVAQQNIQESLELLRYTDSAYGVIQDRLLQMRDLALQYANSATQSTAQLTSLKTQYTNLMATFDASADLDGYVWNGKKVLYQMDAALNFQVGANATADQITMTATDLKDTVIRAAGLGVTTANLMLPVIATPPTYPSTAITSLDTALTTIGTNRSNLGIYMQRLDMALDAQMSLETANTSTVATISNADMAAEVSSLASSQILAQASTAMLGQANIQAQMIIQLLGNL